MSHDPRSSILDPQSDALSLARALDDEFKRVARIEDIPMQALIEEIAALTGCSVRQLYNYRSGKWPLPSSLIAPLCERFKSRLLFELLSEPRRLDYAAEAVTT